MPPRIGNMRIGNIDGSRMLHQNSVAFKCHPHQGMSMHNFSTDVVPITSARARLTEIAAEVVASGQPKVLTRNGESYVAVVGVADLDEFHRLRAADHLRNLHDLAVAAREVASGQAMSASAFRKQAMKLVLGVKGNMQGSPAKRAAKRPAK